MAGARQPLLASAIYETEPVDCEPGSEDFLNAVMEIGFAGEPSQLLQALREIEVRFGRPAVHQRNAPRTVDLDLLYFGDRVIATNDLQIPHPRMLGRRFVLQPLAEVRPEFTIPSQTMSVAALLEELPDAPRVVRAETQW